MNIAFFVIASYQNFKFHLISLQSFEDIHRTCEDCQSQIRAIINKTGKPELPFLYMTYYLDMPHIPIKFHFNNPNGYGVTG